LWACESRSFWYKALIQWIKFYFVKNASYYHRVDGTWYRMSEWKSGKNNKNLTKLLLRYPDNLTNELKRAIKNQLNAQEAIIILENDFMVEVYNSILYPFLYLYRKFT
jgi:hypothetical protein